MRAWALSGAVAAVVSAAMPASAQSPRVDTQISARKVEVGERFIVQATISTEPGSAAPANPTLPVPPGVTASGPNVSTQQQVTISGGQIRQSHGVTATWGLSAARPGTFRIGPPSFQVGAGRVQGRATTVDVIAAGAGPRVQRPSWPPDPFDILRNPGFPSFPGFGLDPSDTNQEEVLPPFPEELKIERAIDPIAFLRARATPVRVVVGEQVTLAIDAYGGRGPFREVSSNEPSHPDFLSFAIITDAHGEQHFRVPIAGATWFAIKIREFALFPLHAGSLRIGPMDMGFEGRGYPASRQAGLRRSSEPILINVIEPPVASRPPGYRVGDVGRYKLSATVEPRQVTAGDAISVGVKLEGTGNLPHQLNTPEQRGVEWLEPTIAEDVEPQAGVLGGWRKFNYVVRLNQPGKIELGEVLLPFWDPQRKAYDVARAALGAVEVKDNPKLANEAHQKPNATEIVLTPRHALGRPAEKPRYIGDRSWFWLLLGAAPLTVLALRGSTLLGKSLRDRWRARNQAHQTRANLALREAQAAAHRNEGAAAASAVERAVHLAIEARIDLRARGVLRDELAATLRARGISSDSAAEAVAVLEACDTLRFTGSDAVTPHALVDRASRLVSGLNRGSPRPEAGAPASGSAA